MDDGYLTDKRTLPVTRVQFSRQGTNTVSMFTVGRLECFGTEPLPTTTQKPSTTLPKTPSTTPSSSATRATTPTTATVVTMRKTGTKSKPYLLHTTEISNIIPVTHIKFNKSSNNSLNMAASSDNATDDLFPTPYLVTIVVIGTVLCLLLIILVGILFKAKVSALFFKRSGPPKPHVEIAEYDPRASVASSDWDFRIQTSFPTSTPDESTTTSEEDIRIRTLEDVRGRRRYGRLGGWSNRTASAPTLGGRMRHSRGSMGNRRSDSRTSSLFSRERLGDRDDTSSSQPYETSSESSKYTWKSTTNTSNSISSRSREFGTGTEGTASDNDDNQQCSSTNGKKQPLDHKVDEAQPSTSRVDVNGPTDYKHPNGMPLAHTCKPNEFRHSDTMNPHISDSFVKINGFSVPYPLNGTYQDPSKPHFQPPHINNCIHRPHIRRFPQGMAHPEYGTHLQVLNSMGRCYFPPPMNRFLPVGKRPFSSGEGLPPFVHPTIQEGAEEEQDVETELLGNNSEGKNSRRSVDSQLSVDTVTSPLDSDNGEETEEQLALLRKRIIEKATSTEEVET